MLLTVLILLAALWVLGYLHLPNLALPDLPLFSITGHVITAVNVLIFAVIVWAVGILPSPLRQIGYAIVVLWVLATLGVIAVAGLSGLLVIAIIVGLIAALFSTRGRAAESL
jgi:hypothetical protein